MNVLKTFLSVMQCLGATNENIDTFGYFSNKIPIGKRSHYNLNLLYNSFHISLRKSPTAQLKNGQQI